MRADAVPLTLRRTTTKVREPWLVLVPLLAVAWIALAVLAFRVHHNGWLYYQGGDEIWYWTTSWLNGHGLLPTTLISPAWSWLLTPFALIAGPGVVSGLPAPILLQALVLTPIAIFCIYDIASRTAGRVVGYIAAGLWVLGPYIAIPLFVSRYHSKYVDQFLPHPLGLTAMGDYPSVVCLIAAGACTVRAYQTRRVEWAVAAGLVTGLAVLTKASNLIFLATPVVLFLVGKRWRELGVFALSLLPALGALTLWKYRGYGFLPAFNNAYEPHQLVLGPTLASVSTPIHKYAGIDWSHLQANLDGLGEVFFSLRVLQFLPFAGAIAVARRSWRLALAFSVWFWLYFLIKGSDSASTVDSGSFFRLVLPAIPALVIMVAALPVLVPRTGTRLVERFPVPNAWIPSRRVLVVAAVLLGLVPLVASAALQPVTDGRDTLLVGKIGVPVDSALALHARIKPGTVIMSWKPADQGSTHVFYRLYRYRGPSDVQCESSGGAAKCTAVGNLARGGRTTELVDHPPPGTWTYRLGVGANWLDDPFLGDIFLVGPPKTVTVPKRS